MICAAVYKMRMWQNTKQIQEYYYDIKYGFLWYLVNSVFSVKALKDIIYGKDIYQHIITTEMCKDNVIQTILNIQVYSE